MEKALLIAEKPSLMRTIRDVYSKHRDRIPYEIDFCSLHGHVMGLKLPSEVDPIRYKSWKLENFPERYPYEYKVTDNKTLREIKEQYKSGGYDFVINAGDPDQEGELLVREVLGYLKNKLPVKRFWSNSLVDRDVLGALENLLDDKDYDGFYGAALIRQHADYQFGMNCTGTLSCAVGKNTGIRDTCKIGRVKAPIISIIAKRELEIRNYVETKTYKPAFKYKEAEFVKNDVFDTPDAALKTVPNTEYAQVAKASSERKEQKAPKLFKLSTLQTAAHTALKFSGQKTLEVLQGLYEAKSVSYPRSGCEYISSHEDIGRIAKKVLGEISVDTSLLTREPSDVQNDKLYANDKAISTEGHTAIIPTGAGLKSGATADEKALYELICRRFIAIFASPKETTSIKVVANPSGTKDDYVYTENYDVTPGYELILNPDYKMKEASGLTFKDGETLHPIEFFAKELTSQKPSRYNDGSLIAALENPEKYEGDDGKVAYKIGTPATRANIIEECQKNGYFKKEKGSFVASEKAISIYEGCQDIPLFMPIESGKWEEMLDKVRNREADVEKVEETLMLKMEDSVEKLKECKIKPYETDGAGSKTGLAKYPHTSSCICPNCRGQVNSGQYGLYCANKCGMSFGKAFGKDLSEKEWEKVLAGDRILLKGLTSKAGKSYNAYVKMKGVKDFSYVSKKTGQEVSGKQVDFEFDGFEK